MRSASTWLKDGDKFDLHLMSCLHVCFGSLHPSLIRTTYWIWICWHQPIRTTSHGEEAWQHLHALRVFYGLFLLKMRGLLWKRWESNSVLMELDSAWTHNWLRAVGYLYTCECMFDCLGYMGICGAKGGWTSYNPMPTGLLGIFRDSTLSLLVFGWSIAYSGIV